MQRLTVGLVIGNSQIWDEVQSVITEIPVRVMLEQPDISDWPAFYGKLQRLRPDVLLVDVATARGSVEEFIAKIKAAPIAPTIIVLDDTAKADTILGAVRGGAGEYLYSPLSDRLRKILEALAVSARKADESAEGKILGFLPVKGGCGATTLACQLAMEIRRQTNQTTLLADFDMEAGMVGFLMRRRSGYTILDAIANLHRLDPSFWKALANDGRQGLDVISAPGPGLLTQPVHPDSLREILRFVQSQYRWTLVDLGHGTSLTASLAKDFDSLYLVTTLEPAASFQTAQVIRQMQASGYQTARLNLIVNCAPKNCERQLDELESQLGVPVYATLPNDYRTLHETYLEGKPLPSGSELAKQIARLARKLADLPDPSRDRRSSLFGLRAPQLAS